MRMLLFYRKQVLPSVDSYSREYAEYRETLVWGDDYSTVNMASFDCIILDTTSTQGRPEDTHFVRTVREMGLKIPIVLITKKEETYQYREAMFDAGVDACVQVPFLEEELHLRLSKVLARKDALMFTGTQIVVGPIEVDIRTHQVAEAGKIVDLTKTEYSFLFHLFLHKNTNVSREKLTEYLDGEHRDVAVGVHMLNLRRKLKNHDLIRTMPRYGFMATV